VATTVVQRRQQTIDTTRDVAWLSHLNPPFSVVLTETTVEHSLGPFVHLGWGMRNQRHGACETKDAVDQFANVAGQDGCFEATPSERLANRQAIWLI